jgi:hypothetical protein
VLTTAIVLSASLVGAGASARDVAAAYYQGDGTGVNWTLELREGGTFAFSWEGCLGNYDRQAGRWRMSGDLVELEVLERKPDPPGKSLPTRFRPIFWGDRVYLVPTEELTEFCNFVNDGTEPRREAHGMVFLRDHDWDRPVSGAPSVPETLRSYLLPAPVRGAIVKRLSSKSALVNRGAKDGLKPGMVMYFQGPDFIPYRVVSTGSATCHLETVYGEDVREGPVSTLLYDPTLQPGCGNK